MNKHALGQFSLYLLAHIHFVFTTSRETNNSLTKILQALRNGFCLVFTNNRYNLIIHQHKGTQYWFINHNLLRKHIGLDSFNDCIFMIIFNDLISH